MLICSNCTHTRLIVSENGLHQVCALSAKSAKNCIMNRFVKFESLNEWDPKPLEPILEPLIRKELEETK